MLQVVAERAVQTVGRAVTVVLGAHAAEVGLALRNSPTSIVINPDWSEGLASSIRAGVASLPGSCSGVMLILADQLAVTAADLSRLIDAWRRQPLYIVAAQYGGAIGTPAIFPRTSFEALRRLHGDRGARVLLSANPDRVVRVPIARATFDIDTREDLLTFTEAQEESPF